MDTIISLSADDVLSIIDEHDSFILTTHVNPDGDALGSEFALFHFLRGLGKDVMILNADPVPENLAFLNGANIYHHFDEDHHRDIVLQATIVLVVDLNDVGRVGTMRSAMLENNAKIVVLDHHPDPQPFAFGYLDLPEKSSTSEIVYDLIKRSGSVLSGDSEPNGHTALNAEMALGIYVGLMTDTGSFRFHATTPAVHRIAAELLEAGVDPTALYRKIFDDYPMRRTTLLGKILAGIESYCEGRVTILQVDGELFDETGTAHEDLESVVNYGLSIRGVQYTALLTEYPDGVKISFRARSGMGVQQVARRFGGGGHKYAAGAFVEGIPMTRLKQDVHEALCEVVRRDREK